MNKKGFPMVVLLLVDSDSRLNWSLDIVSSFRTTKIFISAPKAMIRELNYEVLPFITSQVFNIDSMKNMDVIILGLGGGANHKFLLQFYDYFKKNDAKKRPIVVAGFNGFTDPANSHALLSRVGADFICVNSQNDYQKFSDTLLSLGVSSSSLLLTGLVRSYEVKKQNTKNIVFFAQPDIPQSKRERIYCKAT